MRLKPNALIAMSFGVLFLESAVFLFYEFNVGSWATITYPQAIVLGEHCGKETCLFPPQAVASLYTLQLITFLACSILMFWSGNRSTDDLDRIARLVCALVICGTLLDYFFGNFDFHARWIFPNTIASSPLGAFRYAVLFSIAALCVAILSNTVFGERRGVK